MVFVTAFDRPESTVAPTSRPGHDRYDNLGVAGMRFIDMISCGSAPGGVAMFVAASAVLVDQRYPHGVHSTE